MLVQPKIETPKTQLANSSANTQLKKTQNATCKTNLKMQTCKTKLIKFNQTV